MLQRALLVGGNARDSRKINTRVNPMGLRVLWHWPRTTRTPNLPPTCEVVLFHKDFCRHGGFYKVRDAAQQKGIPTVVIGQDWSKSSAILEAYCARTCPGVESVAVPLPRTTPMRAAPLSMVSVALALEPPVDVSEIRLLAREHLAAHPEDTDHTIAEALTGAAGCMVPPSLVAEIRAVMAVEAKSIPTPPQEIRVISTMAAVLALPPGTRVRAGDLTRWIHYAAVKQGLIVHVDVGTWERMGTTMPALTHEVLVCGSEEALADLRADPTWVLGEGRYIKERAHVACGEAAGKACALLGARAAMGAVPFDDPSLQQITAVVADVTLITPCDFRVEEAGDVWVVTHAFKVRDVVFTPRRIALMFSTKVVQAAGSST